MEFEEWVETGGPRLVRFAYLVCAQRDVAQDLTQDVLVAAYSRWSRLAAVQNMDAYLKKALVNRYHSWWRRPSRREISSTWVDAIAPEAAGLNGERDTAHSELWAACSTLGRRQREAVVLRFYEGMAYAEIADLLSCREATARSLVHRALGELRTTLRDEANS